MVGEFQSLFPAESCLRKEQKTAITYEYGLFEAANEVGLLFLSKIVGATAMFERTSRP